MEGDTFVSIDLNEAADWASIFGFPLSILSLYLIGSVKSNVIASRRRTRLRALFSEISTIQDDALPLSQASKSKFRSVDANLPSGYALFWTAKSKSVRTLRSAIKSEDITSVKESIEDFKSHSEDL